MRSIARVLGQAVVQRRVPSYVTEYVRQHLQQAWWRARESVGRAGGVLWRLTGRRAVWPPTARVEHVDETSGPAAEFRFVSVREAAEDNLAIVARLLRAANVPFFVRDAQTAGPIVIGVDVAERARLCAALAAVDRETRLYVRAVDGARPVPARRVASRRGAVARAERVLVYRNHRLGPGYIVGASHGCLIELWHHAGANLRPPAGARPGRLVPAATGVAQVTVGGRAYPTLSDFSGHHSLSAATMPVDAVYTWVDDRDPRWRRQLERALAREGRRLHPHAANASRYRDNDELRYSLRSLALFAPFVRRIFVVTAGQIPEWLDTDHPDVHVVDHTELLDAAHLPTFNSHAIEARLHHIDGLAEHYIYLNDDFILGREVTAGTFFTPNGLAKLFPDELAPIPAGPPTVDDLPVDSASKNVRDLLRVHCDLHIGRKILHVPYPQRRSVLAELERRFPDEFERTAASRFRHPTDLNIASCLAPYYAFATGRAVPADIAAEYINVAFRWAALQMGGLLKRRNVDAFCINETDALPDRVDDIRAAITRFLQSYLPVPGPWERAGASSGSTRKNDAMSVKP
jgi:hypothetical protein